MLPRLYAIADFELLGGARGVAAFTAELLSAGVMLIQLRAKSAGARGILSAAGEMKRIAAAYPGVRLIMNDRADLCLAAEFDGVHIGQDDLSPPGARKVVGTSRLVGVSTHNPEQVREEAAGDADYVAIGPVFATGSKRNPDPVIGVEGVAAARKLTGKALVAIGGITAENCREAIAAGADSVAVISALNGQPAKSAAQFLQLLG